MVAALPSPTGDPGLYDMGQDRTTRMRFMCIDAKTGERLREFWSMAEPALPEIIGGFYQHIIREPQLAHMIGNDIPRLKSAQGEHWKPSFSTVASASQCRLSRTWCKGLTSRLTQPSARFTHASEEKVGHAQ